jgi:uncharacterized protein (DUF362 family)
LEKTDQRIIGRAKTVVGIAQGDDYGLVTAAAIANAGGLAGIVKNGDTVLIKPNLCMCHEAGGPIITDYRVVAEVVRQVKQHGAKRVIIADGNFTGEPMFTAEEFQHNKYDTIQGVEFYSFNDAAKENCYFIKASISVTGKELYIPKIYLDADVIITVPKMKTNSVGKVTLGLKNAVGVPPLPFYHGEAARGKLQLHDVFGIDNVILEVNLIRKPDFTVVDGMIAGEGNGPAANTPVNARTIIAGRDIVAVDTVSTVFMGFTPSRISYLVLAAQHGLGEMDLGKIKVVGGELAKLKLDFSSTFPEK